MDTGPTGPLASFIPNVPTCADQWTNGLVTHKKRALHNGRSWKIMEDRKVLDRYSSKMTRVGRSMKPLSHVSLVSYHLFPKGSVPSRDRSVMVGNRCQFLDNWEPQTMLISGNPQLTDAFYEPPASQFQISDSRIDCSRLHT